MSYLKGVCKLLSFLPHCMECRRSIAVRPSVHLSVGRVDCDKTKESSAQIFIPYNERMFIIVFQHEKWLVGTILSTWNFGSSKCKIRRSYCGWVKLTFAFGRIFIFSRSVQICSQKYMLYFKGLRTLQNCLLSHRTLGNFLLNKNFPKGRNNKGNEMVIWDDELMIHDDTGWW